MTFRFRLTNEDEGHSQAHAEAFASSHQAYPIQRGEANARGYERGQGHGMRPATTPERWVRRHSFEEVSTNDPGVKLKAPAGSNNSLLNTVTGTVAGLVVYNIASGILTGVMALAAAAVAAFVGYKMFHGGLQGKGGGDDRGQR